MADLSIDCPVCGKANALPVDTPDETFTCSSCAAVSRIDAAAVAQAGPDHLVGEVISDCKIVEKVGEGGFGSVYRAMDQSLQRVVALKVMLPSLTTNVEFVQKFIREAVTAAKLNHPNIVAIHKVDRDPRRGMHYLIMEFVEGRTLADIVKEKGVLRAEEAVPIMLQACDALATAHEHNIVHRDIKPENLMLDAAGVLKITDFGLAKSLATDAKTTKVMGTPHYMSPEQFEGKAVDGRSDIYSLGVTFYYTLSKSRPYEGQNTVQIIYAILTQQPKPLTECNKEVPPELWAVIQKMIAKKAEDRYQSLRETIVDLRRLQERTVSDRAQCPSCGARNPKGRKFCRACGAALVVTCPSCGAEGPSGSATCGACGADIERLLRIKKAIEAAVRFKSLGDLRRAAESYRQVVEMDPSNGEARSEHERLSSMLGEVDRVRTEADELMRTGDLETALGRVEELLRRFPSAAEVREHRDQLRTSLARRRADRLLEQAETVLGGGAIREALDLVEQALRVDPAREDVKARRDELARRLAQASEARQRAAQALAAGRYEEAYSLANDVLRLAPGDTAMEEVRRKAQTSVESVDHFVKRGREHLVAKRLTEALSEFEAAVALRPGDQQLVGLAESTRGRIVALREQVARCRRLVAERDFDHAAEGLHAVLDALPGDAEAKSLLAECERGREEAARQRAVETALREGDRLEKEGDFAGALAQFARVVELEPQHPDALPRKEQVEQQMRAERDIRELANEHLQDGRYGDAVQALERLRRINPARSAALDSEVADCRRREQQAQAELARAETALDRREYRRAQEAAGVVVGLAPRHPRANAIKKDADKAIVAIDRFLGECDRLLMSEMFDEALDALDKAKERGATPEEYRPRREACEQGRLALLKTDATRSIVTRDYEAAIAAYEQVLEVAKSDADAQRGKRTAERRIRMLTTEPLALRLGAAAAVLLLLAVVREVAIAATENVSVSERVVANVEAEKARTVDVDTRQLAPDLAAAERAETARDWVAAGAAYDAELAKFADDEELATGRAFARAMAGALATASPKERIDALEEARAHLGKVPSRRQARAEAVDSARSEAVEAWRGEAERLEATDPGAAKTLYSEIALKAPEAAAVASILDHLDYLRLGEIALASSPPRYERAAERYLVARERVAGDERRSGAVGRRLETLRADWLAAIAAAERAAGDDEERWYATVVEGLEAVTRAYEPLGVRAQDVLAQFKRLRGQ